MSGRAVVGYLLLALMAVCAIQMTLDRGTVHVPIRRQWRVQTQEHGAVRPERRTIGVPEDQPEAPILPLAHLLVPRPRRPILSDLPAPVFVPPRVQLRIPVLLSLAALP